MGGNFMVFEVSKAPKSKDEFINWYFEQVDWKDDLDYEDPHYASVNLQNWFYEMIETFPPMNGPFAPPYEEQDNNPEIYTIDYSISKDCIYLGFGYSKEVEIYNLTRQLATKHGVGFFDVCVDDGDILLPDGTYIHKYGHVQLPDGSFILKKDFKWYKLRKLFGFI